MEKLTRMALLNDFYGQLLTERQRQVLSLYYEDNFSLAEIAEEFSVTRQAVFDLLKRAEKILLGYEDKLGLVKRWQDERRRLSEVLAELRRCHGDGDWGRLEGAILRLQEMLDESGGATDGHV
ncbi:putative DNA-binding protein [Heliomicrobium modesticaldum]|uniref:putative DNA-binding protein n=1 Tax=Heliomicrobium modesticaldum TaxID=35701 RepID=UPI00059BD0B2|nr:putative DNA-binding protein [Heliomicrobium modesticaldum]